MTLIDLPEHPQRHVGRGDSASRWQMPIGKVGPTKIYLSYMVFGSAVVVAIAIASVASRQSKADLPITACIAAGIWIAGWGVQLLTHLAAIKIRGLQLDSVTIGVVGVETRPHAWTATETMLISAVTCLSLIVLGGVFVLPGSGPLWRLPSIEMSSAGTIWHAAAWLFGFQAVCQLFPLPRTLGRQLVIGLVARSTEHHDEAIQVMLVRRALMCIAIVFAMAAMWLVPSESPLFGLPRWLLLSLLAVSLGISSRGRDVCESINGFYVALNLGHQRPPGPLAVVARAIRTWRDRRRAKRVLQQEHLEAVDAARLDGILSQLHQRGADSLSEEDRQILQRMSKSLRRHREAESNSDSPH